MKNIKSRIMAAMLAAVSLCLAACTFGGDDETDYDSTMLAAGTVAPVFTMFTDEEPDGISLAQLRGGYVLIEFWMPRLPGRHGVHEGAARDIRTTGSYVRGRVFRHKR